MADQWYYRLLGEEFGPVTEAALRDLFADGTLGASDEIRRASQQQWQYAASAGFPDHSGSQAAATDLDDMLAPAATDSSSKPASGDPEGLDLDAMLAPSQPGGGRAQSDEWHYRIGGKRFGPFDFDTLFEHATSGKFSRYDEIRAPGAEEWVEAQTIVGLFPDEEADLDSLLADEEPMPAAPAEAAPPKQMWFYRVLNQEMGPVDFEGLFDLVVEGNLRPDDDIREEHSSQWQRADSLVGLFPDDLSESGADDADADFAVSDSAAGDPSAAAEDAEWYFKMDDEELGPVTFERLMHLAEKGRLQPEDPIRLTKLGNWMEAGSMVGLFPEQEPEKPPAEKPAASSVPQRPAGDADDWAAAVLSEPAPQPATPEPSSPQPVATPAAAAPASPPAAMATPAPAQRPTFTPPPKSSRKSSGGGGLSLSLPSGLGDMLADPKVLGGVGAVVLLAGLFFIPWGTLFGASADDLVAQLEPIWAEVKGLYEKEAADSEWTALAGKVGPQLETIAQESKDRGAGPSRPALQITQVLASQHIPKILEEKTDAKPTQIKTVDNFLGRVKEL